jgi:uncharacterized protein
VNDKKREKLFEKLYSKLPTIQCQGLCHEACGPIAGSKFEIERIEKAGGKDLVVMDDLNCTFLTKDKKCSVYEQRPLICRLYGTVKRLRCEHGCEPSRWLSDQEVSAILREVAEIGGETVGPRLPLMSKV